MSLWSRRRFFLTSLAGTAAAGTTNLFGANVPANGTAGEFPVSRAVAAGGTRPIIISSANGVHALQKGMDILKSGGDKLDAAVVAGTDVADESKQGLMGLGRDS